MMPYLSKLAGYVPLTWRGISGNVDRYNGGVAGGAYRDVGISIASSRNIGEYIGSKHVSRLLKSQPG